MGRWPAEAVLPQDAADKPTSQTRNGPSASEWGRGRALPGIGVRPATGSPTLAGGVSRYWLSWWVRGARAPIVPQPGSQGPPPADHGAGGRPRERGHGVPQVSPDMWLNTQLQQNGTRLMKKFPSFSSQCHGPLLVP